ncbi:hypothetical protein ACIRL2_43930 [Embleya sp. NPDC127516]|uniref:hypothetical protein n=1 Tax=Embleya sp. NPDC127516 TaxID=3363990 RepID=UPI003803F7FA
MPLIVAIRSVKYPGSQPRHQHYRVILDQVASPSSDGQVLFRDEVTFVRHHARAGGPDVDLCPLL